MLPKFSRATGDDFSRARSTERESLLDGDSDEDGSNIFGAPEEFRHIRPQSNMKDNISKVKSEIQGVVNVMQNNISKVLDRGAKLDDLQDKSEDLELNATHFRSGSRRIQRKLWWQNCRLKLVLALIVIIVLLVIIVPIIVKNKKKS